MYGTTRRTICTGIAAATLVWPGAASALHITSVSATLVSVNTATKTVNITATENTNALGVFSNGAVLWGDGSSDFWGTPTDTSGTGPIAYRQGFSHVYPDIMPRTITVLSCCNLSNTTTTDTIAINFGCSVAPTAPCRASGTTQIDIKPGSTDAKDQLKWKWQKGVAETLLAAFGNPLTVTENYFCVYAPGLVVDAVVPSSSTLWKASGDKGFKYKDKAGTAGGVTQVSLKVGAAGKSSVQVKAKGAALDDPTMPLTQPVTVQLQNSNGECWGHAFAAPEKSNTAERFTDKEP